MKDEKDEEILKKAKKRFLGLQNKESDIRKQALRDMEFVYDVGQGQWDEQDRKNREEEGRPCFTANKLRKFVANIANAERQNRMVSNVVPVDDKADITTARILQAIVQNIEYQSSADTVYALGGEHALACGFGHWRVLTRYIDDTFDQEIYIEAIENPFAVYMDGKGEYCFVREQITKEDFEEKYPDAIPEDWEPKDLGVEDKEWWGEGRAIYVAEYFVKEYERQTKVQVQYLDEAGQVGQEEHILDKKTTRQTLEDAGGFIINERKIKTSRVMWYKMTASQILEKREWLGKDIPVVAVYGDKVNVGGKEYKRSIIRDAVDSQKMYNYSLTAGIETVALQPKIPYIVSSEQIMDDSNIKKMWDNASKKPYPYLPYKYLPNVLPPQRQNPPQIDSGSMALIGIADVNIKDTSGMYEPSFGQPSNERSGKALMARQAQAEQTMFLFPDNLRRAIVITGRILIDLIPRIYHPGQIVRIRGENGEEDAIQIGATNAETGQQLNLEIGRYDVRADTRIYSTRRQEAVDFFTQLLQYAGQFAPVLIPLMLKYVDVEGAEEARKKIESQLSGPGENIETLAPPGTPLVTSEGRIQ